MTSTLPTIPAPDADVELAAMCPMCRTRASVSGSDVEAGGEWRCARCGQRWDSRRLAAVAAYATWVTDRDRVAAAPRSDVRP